MGGLSDYVKRNSPSITLKDGESVEAIYRGHKIVPNRFNPDKETVAYNLETEFGVKKFSSSAFSLANLFDTIAEGTKIRLTRHGVGNDTKYDLEQDDGGLWKSVELTAEEE